MLHFVLTLAAGFSVGFLLYWLRIPGGMLVGAILGTAILNIGFEAAFMPVQAKVFAQVIAGAYIGSMIERDDLWRMPRLIKPAGIILVMHLAFNLGAGVLAYAISPLDKLTALFCAVPGGISDIPLIAADMGANASQVALAQFARLIVGVGVFPSLINTVCSRGGTGECIVRERDKRLSSSMKSIPEFLLTLIVAVGFGSAGNCLGVPAGGLIFALFGVMVLKLVTGWSYLPMWCKRVAQGLSGAYIGSSMTMADILGIRHLLGPILLIIGCYVVNCFVTGSLLHRFCGMTRKEGMLAATPAGASDMALISMDMGVESSDLIVLQIVRLVVVVSLFPPVIGTVARLLP